MENIELGLHLTSRHWRRFSPEELECLECYVQEMSLTAHKVKRLQF